METTHTVSLMAEHESEEGVFEDVILGTYKDRTAALRAARAHVKRNPDSQAQVIAALPTEPAFTSWSALKALVYIDHEERTGLITERF